MQAVSGLIRGTLGDYFHNLPVPDTFLGWFSLSIGDWLHILPFFGAVGGVGYLIYKQIKPTQFVNVSVSKENPKVVTTCDIEDVGDKAVYCRCWRSKKFPFCDGSHTAHNKDTGDNVGPLIVKRNTK